MPSPLSSVLTEGAAAVTKNDTSSLSLRFLLAGAMYVQPWFSFTVGATCPDHWAETEIQPGPG